MPTIDVYYAALAYNANHGAGAPATQTQSAGEAGYAISFTISSSRPSRTYYTFLGWSTNSGATSASYAPGGSISVNTSTTVGGTNTKTLYAVWQHQTAYVYYNANGGSGAPSTQSHWAGYSITLSSTVPTRTGYKFLGWATSASAKTAQYQPGTSQALYTTTTLYAVWELAASTLTVSNGTIGTALSIGINRNNSSYTDTIAYTFGTASGTIATKTSSDSVSWTPPLSLASEIPNASTGTCTLTCTTYNGSTVIGTTTKSITLTVPQSLAPTVSVSYADTIAQCLTWGLLVQSRSKLAFTITASGQQGATIASYSTSVNGTSYNSASFTTDVLLYNGTNSYTVTVTDSRGLQTVSTGTFSVVTYSNPSLTLTLCDRNDSDPDQVDIGFDFSIASVSNNNDAKYRLDYKLKSASTWTNGTVQSLGAYSGSISDLIASLDGGDEWDIRINVIDSFQTASVESEVGVSGNILLNSRHQGGLGILMKSQADNQLDVGKKTVFHETVDVIQRRAYATLNATGWKRIINYNADSSNNAQGASGQAVDICVLRTGSENHSVTMRMNSSGSISFTDESSKSTSLVIDKIRYTYDGDNIGHVDVHINSGSSYSYGADFIVHAVSEAQSKLWTSADFESVLDAPSGETILTTYSFVVNTGAVPLYSSNTGLTYNSSYVTGHNIRIRVYGKIAIVCGWIRLSSEPPNTAWLIKGIPTPNDEINIIYFDQSSNTCGALYISQKNGEWCINTGGYSQSGHTSGHYLNLVATYIVADSSYAPI